MATSENSLELSALPGAGYRAVLLDEFQRRKHRNPRYSIRAFAKALGISKTALADALASRRNLSRRSALRVAGKLAFPTDVVEKMLEDIREVCAETDSHRFKHVDDDFFSLIAGWQNYALLCLAELEGNLDDPDWLAAKLDLPSDEARSARDRLCRLGLLERRGGRLYRTTRGLTTGNDVPSAALREHHRQNLRRADASLDRDPVDDREMTSVTMALRREDLPRAKKLVRHFRRRLSRLLESEKPDAIYTLAIQLFPVTPREKT